MKKPKILTSKKLEMLLRTARAQGARQYSSHERYRIIYRDGFTDGWSAREDHGRIGDVIE